MKVKTSRYERILYIVTALLLVLTLENIIKDKVVVDSLKKTKLNGLRNFIIGKLILYKQVSLLMIISKIAKIIMK